MRRFLIALSGARPEVLERCPTEYGKFEGIGGAVLTTSVLAVVSMTFALNSALGVNLFLAIVASLLWGLAILSLDRWLVSTLRADASLRHRLFTALPRFLMALLLGFVISTPLVLQIFKGEIDAQIVEIKQRRADSFAAQQKQGDVGADVARLREEVADLEKVTASGGEVPIDPAQDPKIKALTQDRANEQKQSDKHYKEWQCQLYGGPSCPKKGNGPLAQDSKRAYEKNKQRIALLNRQIEQRRKELAQNDEAAKQTRLADAQEALPKARAELDAALKRQADLQASFDAENLSTNGVLIRLQALNEVTGTDTTLGITRLLLFLLFLVIECLPVTVKLMQRPGNYEKVLALAEQHEFRNARGSFTPGFTPAFTPGPAAAAPMAAEPANGSAGLWDIWGQSRPGDTGPQPTVVLPENDQPYRGPTGTRAEKVPGFHRGPEPEPEHGFEYGPDYGYGSPDDEALRRMSDTRTTRLPGRAAEHSGGVELLPDDD